MDVMNPLDLKIIALLCHWCAYDSADAAGRSKQDVPPQIREVRVRCSGQVDPAMVLKAFAAGADGVMVLGCKPGDCHYRTGNQHALKRMRLLQKVMAATPIDPRRLRLDWVSAGEGDRYARLAQEMVAEVKALGPVDVNGGM
jgi:F420-non-reducing hydrogenase iron-sulfur subunit